MPKESLPRISLVVAVADNGVIGNAGDLPWRMSGDLQRFKQLTMGHVLVMGRKTYESIGRPLPGRVTVVLTTNRDYAPGHTEVRVAHSLEDATAQALKSGMNNDELFVVGGAEIYRLALSAASRIYRTRVHASPGGDAHFPELPSADWQVIESHDYPADAKSEFACTWEVLERTP
ncbi:dihydrofolate reductase [Aeoliella sp. SH292]|jgi:dihydrofolate reductase|uniref:dihydrofolate reductase n=1 Tax=Aeoliella sp. SH292 TaxID=3454464 RepID=UPI003F9886B9